MQVSEFSSVLKQNLGLSFARLWVLYWFSLTNEAELTAGHDLKLDRERTTLLRYYELSLKPLDELICHSVLKDMYGKLVAKQFLSESNGFETLRQTEDSKSSYV